MTARTWKGNQDGNNLASNPNNWDPTGAPQPSDSLAASGNVTMDIVDNALQGDTLTLRNGAATLNLTHNGSADLVWSNSFRPPATFDRVASVTVNVEGNGTLKARDFVNPRGGPTDVTVNLSGASNSQLFGSFNLTTGTLKINGGDKSKFVNDSTTTLNGVQATINTDVVGSGTFTVGPFSSQSTGPIGGSIEFADFVSEEQTVSVEGINNPFQRVGSTATVDAPKVFHATFDLHDLGFARLSGLADSSSWNYANNTLSIFDAKGKTIDQVHVISDGSSSVHGLFLHKSPDSIIVGTGSEFQGTLS